jgi:hypothetical protein
MPLLINMGLTDYQGPMQTLQVTRFEKDDFFELVKGINSRIREPLDSGFLQQEFNEKWPALEKHVMDTVAIATVQDDGNAKPDARPKDDVLENLATEIRNLRQDVRRINDDFPRKWPQINEGAVVDEVMGLMQEAGLSPEYIDITDVHSNGQIFLEVYVDGPVNAGRNRLIKRALSGAPRYAIKVIGGQAESSPAIVTTSTVGGSRVVGPPTLQDESVSDGDPA